MPFYASYWSLLLLNTYCRYEQIPQTTWAMWVGVQGMIVPRVLVPSSFSLVSVSPRSESWLAHTRTPCWLLCPPKKNQLWVETGRRKGEEEADSVSCFNCCQYVFAGDSHLYNDAKGVLRKFREGVFPSSLSQPTGKLAVARRTWSSLAERSLNSTDWFYGHTLLSTEDMLLKGVMASHEEDTVPRARVCYG